MSSTDVLIYIDVISNKQSDPLAVIPNKLASLRSKRFRMASQQRETEERDSRFWPREKWIPPPRSFTYAIFREVFDSRSSGLPRSLLLNCTETLATQASNWPSLVSTARSPSPIILWRLWSHKPSHKHDSNKYQSKAFVICDHKSDETRSVTLVNKAYLVWLMFRVLSNQHY